MKKALRTLNVDVKEGIVFLKAGQYYGSDVYEAYPDLFEGGVQKVEPIKTVEEAPEVPEVPEIPEVLVTSSFEEYQNNDEINETEDETEDESLED